MEWPIWWAVHCNVHKLDRNAYRLQRVGSDDRPKIEHIDNLVATPLLSDAVYLDLDKGAACTATDVVVERYLPKYNNLSLLVHRTPGGLGPEENFFREQFLFKLKPNQCAISSSPRFCSSTMSKTRRLQAGVRKPMGSSYHFHETVVCLLPSATDWFTADICLLAHVLGPDSWPRMHFASSLNIVCALGIDEGGSIDSLKLF